MRLFEVSSTYSNWTTHSSYSLHSNFEEYKKKESSKWRSRAPAIGARFPIFKDYDHFVESIKNAKVVDVTDSMDRQIHNRSRTSSIEELKDLVSGYVRPRNVDRIVKGFKRGDAIPYPIILKGSKGMWILAGNTRLDAAGIMGVPKKALIVDVSDTLSETVYSPKPMEEDAKKIATFIKKNCKPWLSQTQNGKLVVYRGIEKPPTGVAFVKPVRKNRVPLHSSQTLHELLNAVAVVGGKKANRKNAVAVTGHAHRTNMYGDKTFVVMPIGQFNYTWHIDLIDWAEDFIHTYADSNDVNQLELSEFEIDLPKPITKQWIDNNFEAFLLKGVRGDDGTLAEAISGGFEIMIKANKVLAIDIEFYEDEIKPLLQKASLKEGHKHKWSYIGGAAVCKCGKQISPDGEITDATAGMMKARKKMFEERQKGTPLSAEIPDEVVQIFRAQPVTQTSIEQMAYVTRSLKFAKDHAVHMSNTEEVPYHVVRALVPTRSVFNAYNPGEYFYDGSPVNGKSVFNAKPGDDFAESLNEQVVTHELEDFMNRVKEHYGLEDLWISKIDDKTIYLMSIIVPKELRKQGIGTKVMNNITQFADERGLRVILSPATKDPHHGTTSYGRLVDFYKQFGFKQNKGRNKDFTTSARMIREPRSIH